MEILTRLILVVGASTLATLLVLAVPGVAIVASASGSDSSVPFQVVATIPLASQSGSPAYDGANGNLYVPSGFEIAPTPSTSVVTVVSGATNTIVGNVTVGGNPGTPLVDPLNGDVYVSNSATGNVSVISGATDSLIATIAVGGQPMDPALDTVTGDLFVPKQESTVSVISGDSNTVVANLSTGFTATNVVCVGTTGEVYVSGSSGVVDVFSATKDSLVTSIPLGGSSAGPLLYDHWNGVVYAGSNGSISVINVSGPTVVGKPWESVGDPAFLGPWPWEYLYALRVGSPSTVTGISPEGIPVTGPFPVGNSTLVAYDPIDGYVLGVEPGALPDVLTVFSLSTGEAIKAPDLGAGFVDGPPTMDPGNGYVYIVKAGAANTLVVLGSEASSGESGSSSETLWIYFAGGAALGVVATGVIAVAVRRGRRSS